MHQKLNYIITYFCKLKVTFVESAQIFFSNVYCHKTANGSNIYENLSENILFLFVTIFDLKDNKEIFDLQLISKTSS